MDMKTTASAQASIDLIHAIAEEVWNGRDYDRIDDLVAEDFLQHGPVTGMETNGRDGLKKTVRQYHEAFSDLESHLNLVFCDESGEYVCAHLTHSGTHDGELMGIPATDREGAVDVTGIYRIEDDRIAESWVLGDVYGLFNQLGTLPRTGPFTTEETAR